MKPLRNLFLFALVFLLISLNPTANEDSELATLASKLLGHWEDSKGIQYYFGPLDSNTHKGSIIFIIPDSRELFEQLLASYRNAIKGWEELDKFEKIDLRYLSERFGGVTFYWQYEVTKPGTRVNSQGNTTINVKLIPAFHNSGGGIFEIDKDGKKMEQKVISTTPDTFSLGPWLFGDGTLIFIDSKIAPENNSTTISPDTRDLSTPLSRLAGHWKAYQGSNLYFSPVDPSTMIGSYVHVFPEFTREMFDKFKAKLNHIEGLSKRKKEKVIKMYSETAKQYSGLAVYCKYEVITQKKDGERIGIFPTCENSDVMNRSFVFHVDENGEFMTDKENYVFEFLFDVEMLSDLLEEQELFGQEDDWEEIIYFCVLPDVIPHEEKGRRFIYIDSKTSPENKK